jgi:hypothetical protein
MGGQTLPARFLPGSDVSRPLDGALIAFDPWSEAVQHHGAAGRGDEPRMEMRAPHHIASAASPLSDTGYVLDVLGRASSARDVIPDAPMARLGWQLWRRLGASRARIAKLVRQAIVGTAAADWRIVAGDAEILVWQDGERWELSRRDRPMVEGDGLATLAAAAYGIPVGVAGVRIFEASVNVRFDAHTAQEMAALLDRWQAAGAPTRKPRP